MGLSKLSKKCKDCLIKDICEDKEMEAVATLPVMEIPSAAVSIDEAAEAFRKMSKQSLGK